VGPYNQPQPLPSGRGSAIIILPPRPPVGAGCDSHSHAHARLGLELESSRQEPRGLWPLCRLFCLSPGWPPCVPGGGGPDLVCGRPFLTLCPRRCGIGRRQAALVLHCQQATHCTQRRKRARVPAHGTSCEHRVVVRTICRQTGQVSNRPRAYDERSNATTQSHRWRRHRVPSCATLSRDCNASAVNGWCTQARPPTRVKANGLPQSKSRQPDGANWGPHRREGQSTGRAAPSHHYPPCFRANSAEVGMMWTELGR